MALLTKFWGLDVLAVCFVLIILFYLYMTRNFNYWTKRGVEQIPTVPFFGSFKEIILQWKTPGHFFRDLYVKFLDRVASYDYKVPGGHLVIEKGTPVLIPMLGLHFDEDYFPDPYQFNPDNFSEENKRARKAGVYIPFGDGPHVCIASRLGLVQTKLAIITILPKYELSPCRETLIPMRLNPRGIFTTSDGGIFLQVRQLVE